MNTLVDLDKWLDPSGSNLILVGQSVAQRHSQQYFRGPQILLAALELGILDIQLIRMGLEPDEIMNWLSVLAEKAVARWSSRPEPTIDSSVADGLVALGRTLERPLDEYDIVEAIVGDRLGFLVSESRGCPFSFDDLHSKLTAKRHTEAKSSVATGSAVSKTTDHPAKSFDAVLTRYTTNLSKAEGECSNRLYENRLNEVRRVAAILGRLTRRNPLIVGNPGVGKTAVIEGLAAWIKTKDVPEWLKGIQVFSISCSSLIAGAGYRGQLEERVQQIIDAAIVRKDIVLFLDDIHVLADPASGSSSFLGLFNQYLTRGSFRMIAAATTRQFDSWIRDNDAFVRRFEVVKLDETNHEQTISILKTHLPRFEAHYGQKMDESALQSIVHNCERYLPSRSFPDKAISTMDSAFQKMRSVNTDERGELGCVTSDIVLEVISEETSIPVSRLGEMEEAKLKGLQEYLETRVYDQHKATKSISRAIQSLRLGLGDPKRTGLSFLLVGPPGTGKTELAKASAEYLMGSESALVRFNMSEFQTPESYQRLVGPPPGYVGFDEGGELTNRLTENPYSVVLFDEIEKGSSRVFDIFLQVLSDGHLTDSHGRIVDCKNSMFIMTSNALADVGDCTNDQIRELLLQYRDAQKMSLGPTFRPEFLDRLQVVPFDRLSSDTLKRIAHREVSRVLSQVNTGHILDCEVTVEDATMDWIIDQIDDKSTGARSVQRLVENSVSQVISDSFIQGSISKNCHYTLRIDSNEKLELVNSVNMEDTNV